MVTICEKCVGVILGPWDPETEPEKKLECQSTMWKRVSNCNVNFTLRRRPLQLAQLASPLVAVSRYVYDLRPQETMLSCKGAVKVEHYTNYTSLIIIIPLYIYIYMYVFIYMWICIYRHIYNMCVYNIYIYMYVYVYVYIYIYIYNLCVYNIYILLTFAIPCY